MSCEHYHELLSAALDGELDAAEELELERHLALCPRCEDLGRTYAALKRATFAAIAPVAPLEP
ncbi:MAG: zf-HC2 domain-containing protein, partial [Myxococcales bacterium]|nr:zf-HC2 domain-containing protein [Myxococcales bacterium]